MTMGRFPALYIPAETVLAASMSVQTNRAQWTFRDAYLAEIITEAQGRKDSGAATHLNATVQFEDRVAIPMLRAFRNSPVANQGARDSRPDTSGDAI